MTENPTEKAMPTQDLGPRKLVNDILAGLIGPYEPDFVKRVEIGNKACTEIIAALTRPPAGDGEAFAAALENSDFANVAHELNSQMCCNGHMCGCRGSTVGEYLAHELRTLIHATPNRGAEDGVTQGDRILARQITTWASSLSYNEADRLGAEAIARHRLTSANTASEREKALEEAARVAETQDGIAQPRQICLATPRSLLLSQHHGVADISMTARWLALPMQPLSPQATWWIRYILRPKPTLCVRSLIWSALLISPMLLPMFPNRARLTALPSSIWGEGLADSLFAIQMDHRP